MTFVRLFRIAAVTLPLVLASHAASGQSYGSPPYVQQSLTPDADALAEQMRALAANPGDVNAMVRAGELTLKLDDATAAAGFFARAERIDPNNPRIKAGKGTLLVMAGRPGEALQRFAEAEMLRGDVRQFAADRGLAYDLIGEQERAQRDYRLALRQGPADETLRRYALSLGISGRREEALLTIDPLLRRSDRGAWRARAFILAMTGDAGGAERIAASMMPGGLGQGLQPFFDRLPRLGAADRAFAVHFGEVHVTPQRLADARLTPRLPMLTSEPGRPVAVAAAAVPQPARDDRRDGRDRRQRGRGRIDLVTVAPPSPLPQPPAYQPPAVATRYAEAYAPAAVTPIGQLPVPTRTAAIPLTTIPLTTPPLTTPPLTTLPVATVVPGNEAAVRSVPPSPRATEVATARPVVVETKPVAALVQLASATLPPAVAAPPPLVPSSAPVADPAASIVPSVLPPVPGPATGGDSILAKIVANITVPGSELEDAAVEPAAATAIAADDAQAALIADGKAANRIANAKALAALRAAEKRAEAAPPPDDASIVRRRGETARQFEARKRAAPAADKASVPVQRRGETAKAFAARRAAADDAPASARKPGESARAYEVRKATAAKPTKEPKEPKNAEPARIWVQVSSGANEGDLPKAWDKVRKEAPVAMRGRSGWMTPWRATNRVLAGPFRSDAEARGFVNALGKEGVSAFSFTSEAGQKVSRLTGK